ncbi:MAG: glycerol-3-phosphate dehydrogenase/oxidase [Desulfobacterales bacterium]|nr:MAG: glycerol-3-phosphate dehydrogenase/oxidase [Desulfobacterales bacterium]
MTLKEIPEKWDLIVIGGGITGAGILREATRLGLRVLLVEQKDFAWGTSSRSSKLVHGGLRYLKEGHFLLTKIAVEEREQLLKEAPGLVEPLGFLLPVYEDQRPGRRMLKVGLSLYDLMARERQHRFYDAAEFAKRLPRVKREGLIGGFFFIDAQVDDSRLVLRLINEAVASGACALNYSAVTAIHRNALEEVVGVRVMDTETGEARDLVTPAVINATGCWAERLHPSPEPHRHLRPLRGSHLVFPAGSLPVSQGLSFVHPADQRVVFIIPWAGAILVGTTDLDHTENLSREPTITEAEVLYLMEGVKAIFPSLEISLKDCLAAFAGIRPVLSEGKRPPSEESREHVVWINKGLVTVTGGKLTTFRRLAWDALKAAKPFLPPAKVNGQRDSIFFEVPDKPAQAYGLGAQVWRRLYGRYGQAATSLVRSAAPQDLSLIPGTHTLWAELPFVARHEQVRHLGDLLLRRVRIGLLAPAGGKPYLKRIRKLCQPVLPWDRKRWRKEIRLYLDHWNQVHALPFKRAEVRAERKRISLSAIGARLSFLYAKVVPRWRRGKS